ncbi:MAG: zinc-binding dehydrogenase [Leptospira sp.]|nr:zinc-binding dehydrogenase [Leptospira sp.]
MQREVYRVIKPGSIQDLSKRIEELPPPNDDEITVQVRAIGLNFADIFAIYGLYSATPKESFVPGLEYAGVIIAKGKNVKKFKEGDSIYGTTRFGAYATHLNINQNYIYSLPKDWSFAQGASYSVQALTAYYALVPLGNIQKSQTILIHSGAGGVGLYANQIAKKWNAYTIALIGSESKIQMIKNVGYDDYILRSSHFKNDLMKKLSGKRLDLVLECMGGHYFQDSYDLLSPMGRLITYGSAVFTPQSSYRNWIKIAYQYLIRPKIDPLKMISDNKSVMGFNLIWLWNEINELKKHFDALQSLNLRPQVIGESFSFENMKDALEKFKKGNTIGKIIINVP